MSINSIEWRELHGNPSVRIQKAAEMRTGNSISRPSRQQQFEEVKTRIHSKLVDKLDLTRVGDLRGDTLNREIRLVVEHLCDAEETLLNR